MTVTNSLNTNPLSPLDEGSFKKSNSVPNGGTSGFGMGMSNGLSSNNTANGSISAKKENDDKKKWRKRI